MDVTAARGRTRVLVFLILRGDDGLQVLALAALGLAVAVAVAVRGGGGRASDLLGFVQGGFLYFSSIHNGVAGGGKERVSHSLSHTRGRQPESEIRQEVGAAKQQRVEGRESSGIDEVKCSG